MKQQQQFTSLESTVASTQEFNVTIEYYGGNSDDDKHAFECLFELWTDIRIIIVTQIFDEQGLRFVLRTTSEILPGLVDYAIDSGWRVTGIEKPKNNN
jgi:hypothetical protein